MQTLRTSLLAFVLLALSALSASAQIQTGTAVYFDHDADSVADTAKYQLCVDGVDDQKCADVAALRGDVRTVGAVQVVEFNFTVPAWVPRGNHTLQIRAIGIGDFGPSAGSNSLSQRIIGKPLPPTLLRLQQAVTP